jgi:hypothetical protein
VIDRAKLEASGEQDPMREFCARQENVVFPDTIASGNEARVDAVLWRPSPDRPLVQRVGIAIIAIMPGSIAFLLVYFTFSPGTTVSGRAVLCLMAAPFAYATLRMLRNAIYRGPRSEAGAHRG